MNKFINNVEIQGIIGSVRETQIGEQYVYNISVCTEYRYTSKDGMGVVENTWHSVTFWSSTKRDVQKGKWIHVKGHLKMQMWSASDGSNRTSIIIQANNNDVELLNNK